MTRLCALRFMVTLGLTLLLACGLLAGVLAQASAPLVTITRIGSQTFPEVAVDVAVSGPDGLPVVDLTAPDFVILEEGQEISATAVTVTEDVPQDLRLVLALDVSVPPEALLEIKQAVNALLETMGPQDRVALIAFADGVSLAYDFTNNKTELQATLDTLSPQGDSTALNQAAFEAINLTTNLTMGRRAVLIITDSRDNTGGRAITEVITQAQANQVPLYLLSFGPKVGPNDFIDLASATRGQVLNLATPAAAQETLLNLAAQLRQGYRLTFQSSLKADGAEHELSLRVTTPAGEGQAAGSFIATQSPVTIALMNLTNGQTVTGRIDLVPQVTAPALIATVEYLLDGQSLTQITTPPYNFTWDSTTVSPGPHQLTAKVTDSAGNEGQTEVNLNVVVPLVVMVTPLQSQIKLGEAVPVQTRIEATAEIARVDFLLDGVLLGSHTAPPYSFSFDSSQYTIGPHTLTVRVEDRLGQQAEDSFTLEFLAPPVPQPTWLERLLKGAAIATVILLALILVLLIFILFRLIVAWQKRRRARRYQLELANLGNIPLVYEVWGTDPAGALKFQFKLNGAPLPQRQQVVQVMSPPLAASPVEMSQPSQRVPVAPASPSSSSFSLGGAREKADQAYYTGSTVATLLDTVGNLLPGPLGAPLRNTAGQIYRQQRQIDAVRRTQDYVTNTTSYVSYQAGQVVPGRSGGATGASYPPTMNPATETISGPVAPSSPGPIGRQVQNGSLSQTPPHAQTPQLEPGQTLLIDLLIAPLNPYRTQDHSFTLNSKAVEATETPLVTEQGSVHLVGLSWFHRLPPILLTVVLIVGVILLTGLALFWLVNMDFANLLTAGG